MNLRFDGKVALVTGAATGIGQATAARLAADGAIVAVNHRPDTDPAETLDRIGAADGQGFAVPADMRDPEQVTAMVRGVASRAGRPARDGPLPPALRIRRQICSGSPRAAGSRHYRLFRRWRSDSTATRSRRAAAAAGRPP